MLEIGAAYLESMDIETLRKLLARPGSFSTLETVDVHTGERTVLKEFDHVIEAPNWTRDGLRLIYNSLGCMYEFDLSTGRIDKIDTGFAVDCNNDHVLSPDGTRLAVAGNGNLAEAERLLNSLSVVGFRTSATDS